MNCLLTQVTSTQISMHLTPSHAYTVHSGWSSKLNKLYDSAKWVTWVCRSFLLRHTRDGYPTVNITQINYLVNYIEAHTQEVHCCWWIVTKYIWLKESYLVFFRWRFISEFKQIIITRGMLSSVDSNISN